MLFTTGSAKILAFLSYSSEPSKYESLSGDSLELDLSYCFSSSLIYDPPRREWFPERIADDLSCWLSCYFSLSLGIGYINGIDNYLVQKKNPIKKAKLKAKITAANIIFMIAIVVEV